MKYFLGVKNANELKSLYRKLCNELHPDKGGNASEFITMMDEYNSIKDSFNNETESENLNAEQFYNLLQQLEKLTNIRIEFIGSFIWLFDEVEGSMYQQKEIIKSFIFDGYNSARWAKVKKSWYFSPADYKSKGKAVDLNLIKTKYGVQSFQSKGILKIK